MHFTDFDIDRFLSETWQKRPLLIRNPWAGWRNPLEPDELAGLACEEGVESRLIVRGKDGLAMESGPCPKNVSRVLARNRGLCWSRPSISMCLTSPR
jgi:50S ribosomal protein L16 3-hydroxylase